MKKHKRIQELDSLRGLAAISVILFHYTFRYKEKINSEFDAWFTFEFGEYGVQFFFIISGFVIFLTSRYVKNTFEFAFRRFVRLFPTYWTCLIISFIGLQSFGVEQLKVSNIDFLVNFTMVHKLLGFESVDGAYWSLVPELFFYFFIAVLLITKSFKYLNVISFLWLLGIALNYFTQLPVVVEWALILNFGMFFVAGMHFFKIYSKEASLINYVIIALSYFVCIMYYPDTRGVITMTLLYVLFFLFVFGHLKFLAVKPLIYLGKISYALYLIHQYLGYSIIDILNTQGFPSWSLLIIPLIFSLTMAWFITEYIEAPILKFLKQWYRSKQKIALKLATVRNLILLFFGFNLLSSCSNSNCMMNESLTINQEKKYKVIIIAGQSNAVGSGDLCSIESFSFPENVVYKNYGFHRSFLGTFYKDDELFGSELSLATNLAHHPENFIIFKYAFGSTALEEWLNDNGKLKDLKNIMDSNLGAIDYETIAFVWMLGETDSRNRDLDQNYSDQLNQLHKTLKREFPPTMPMIIAKSSLEAVNSTLVQEAQSELALKEEEVFLIETNDLGLNEDHVHYSTDGQLELGERIYNILLKSGTL